MQYKFVFIGGRFWLRRMQDFAIFPRHKEYHRGSWGRSGQKPVIGITAYDKTLKHGLFTSEEKPTSDETLPW